MQRDQQTRNKKLNKHQTPRHLQIESRTDLTDLDTVMGIIMHQIITGRIFSHVFSAVNEASLYFYFFFVHVSTIADRDEIRKTRHI